MFSKRSRTVLAILVLCFALCFSAAAFGAEVIMIGQQDHSTDMLSEEEMAELPHLLTPYQSYNTIWYAGNEVDCFKMADTGFYQGFVRKAYGNGPEVFFDLRKAFREVTFQIGHADGARTGNGTLHIYLDDVPAQDIVLTPEMSVEDITLDVSGVTQLKLWIEGADAGYGIGNITAYGGHLYSRSISDLITGSDEIEYTYTCDCCGYKYQAAEVPDPAEETYLSPYQMINVYCMENTDDELDCFYATGLPRYKGVNISNYDSEREVIYNLSKEYSSITFTVGHIDNARTGSAVMTIYGDGQLIREEELYYTMLEKEITLDTKGLTQLKIHYSGGDSAYGIYGMTYEKDENGAADAETAVLPAADENVYLEPYEKTNMRRLDNIPESGDCFHTMGRARTQGCVFTNYSSDREVIYNLNSEYSTVAFTIGHVDMERRGEAVLRIYGDGDLLAEFQLNYDMIDQPFMIDATGMTQLKLAYEGGDSAYGIYDVIAVENETCAVQEKTVDDNAVFLTPYQTANIYCLPDENDPERSFYIMGVGHKQGFSITNYSSDREAIYSLNGAYSQVVFSVGHIDGERKGSAVLRIYGDDVLMQEEELTYDMIDRTYTVNTSGLTQITISYNGTDSAYGIYDVYGIE